MNSKILGINRFQKYGDKDKKWTIRDKVNMYKGVLKLHGRDEKLKSIEAIKAQKRVSKELKILSSEVKEYHKNFSEIRHGDQERMRNVLQNHRDLLLAYENQEPTIVYDAIYQDCNLKRRQLDKLYYVKRNKMKQFFDLKLESTTILNQLDEQSRLKEPDRHQQKVAALYQKAVANKSAAETIQTTYKSIINILEKDTVYFNAIINKLKSDKTEQCKVMIKTTYMGQLATENLDNIRTRYKKMSNDVIENMNIRERSLKNVRSRVENLKSNIKILIRVESHTKYVEGMATKKKSSVEENLAEQIKSLGGTLGQVKDVLQARSYDELLYRLEEQTEQRARLMEQFKTSLSERDAFVNKKNCAELILADLKHSMLSTTSRYKFEKNSMLKQIEEEKQHASEFIKLKKSRGELLIDIKVVLQNLLAVMVGVKTNVSWKQKVGKDNKKNREKRKKMEVKNRYSEDSRKKSNVDEKYEMEKFDSDASVMLDEVRKKAIVLLELSNFEISPEDIEKAQDSYYSYIANYYMNNFQSGIQPEPRLSMDHEVIDTRIPTYAEIKMQSKQIVEMHTKFD